MTSSLPLHRDLTVYAGATFKFAMRWYSGGEEVNMTGWSAWMPYGTNLTTPLGEFSTDDGTIVLTADGHITLQMTDEQSADFAANPAFPKVADTATLLYNLTLENDGGEQIRYMKGALYVVYDLPRPVTIPKVQITLDPEFVEATDDVSVTDDSGNSVSGMEYMDLAPEEIDAFENDLATGGPPYVSPYSTG